MAKFVHAVQRLAASALISGLAVSFCAAADLALPDGYAGLNLVEALGRLQSLGLKLVYSSDLVRPGMRVEREPLASNPREILDELLAPHGLEAREGPGSVLFIVEGGDRRPTGRIEGVVRSRHDDEPVASAWIIIEGEAGRAISDSQGRFRFDPLQPGEYDLIVKVPGLEDERFDAVMVRSGLRTLIVLHLEMSPLLRERIIVSSEPAEPPGSGLDSGTRLGGEELRAFPLLGGDAQRAAGERPGVASADRSAGLSVRGGAPNEVLYRMDGQDLYDPFHLKHFQSVSGIVDADAVGEARFFSEAFPAEYGDRMSGVLDLSSSIPTSPGSTVLSSSFINSRFLADGRFREGDGHWLLSARGWYPDAVVNVLDREKEGFSPTYFDLLGKAQVQLGPRALLTGHFLAARDNVDFIDPTAEEQVGAGTNTQYYWITLESLWAPRLQSRTLLSYGTIDSERIGSVVEDQFVASVDDRRDLAVIGFSQDWVWQQSQQARFKWGLSAKRLQSEYEYRSGSAAAGTALDDSAVAPELDRATELLVSGRQYGLYASSRLAPLPTLTIETGLRWDSQTYTGESQVSPRVSIVQSLSGTSRVRAAWGRYYQSQGVHELQVEDGVTEFFPAQKAEHWIVGFEQDFDHGLRFRVDAYRKEMSGLSPRYENLFNPFELLPEFEPDRIAILPSAASSRGIDLTLAGSSGREFAWSASYSYSSTEDTIDGVGVPRSWDQPHAFRFQTSHRIGAAWELGVAGEYHTGWPTTDVIAAPIRNRDGSIEYEVVPGRRNGARFPDYQRLDLRISRHIALDRSSLTLFLEITNLLDRRNVCCVEGFTVEPGPAGEATIVPDYGYWLPRVPSFGVTWRFDR